MNNNSILRTNKDACLQRLANDDSALAIVVLLEERFLDMSGLDADKEIVRRKVKWLYEQVK